MGTLIFNDFFGNNFHGFADYFSHIYCWKYLECVLNVPWHFVAWFSFSNKMKYYNPIFWVITLSECINTFKFHDIILYQSVFYQLHFYDIFQSFIMIFILKNVSA